MGGSHHTTSVQGTNGYVPCGQESVRETLLTAMLSGGLFGEWLV